MKTLKFALSTAIALMVGLVSTAALAGPILETDPIVTIERFPDLGALGVTDVADPMPVLNPTASIPYAGGSLILKDKNGAPLTTSQPNPLWWSLPDVVYYTNTNVIDIIFDNLAVTAVTFNLGINQNASGWIKAWYDTPVGSGTLKTTPNFALYDGHTNPNDSFGVYINDPAASCATISKVRIEPPLEWGVGNFGIRLADPNCGSVPEPNANFLLGLGLLLLGLGFQGQRNRVVLVRS